MTYTQTNFERAENVTPEIAADFAAWHNLLQSWNAKINLVSKSAMDNFWQRHALDSWQLWPHVPAKTRTILDLGSGGGFPGIALAIGCKHKNQGHVTLVESAGKKASFLRAAIRELGLPAKVTTERAERLPEQPYDIISARAFAPLPRLLRYASPFWAKDTKALLLKGQKWEDEILEARQEWQFDLISTESLTDPEARLLIIDNLTSI